MPTLYANARLKDSSRLQESPELALPEFKRHVNVMLETRGSMIETATATVPDHALILSAENRTNKEFTSLRQPFTQLPDLSPQILEHVPEMLDYAIRIQCQVMYPLPSL